MLSARFSEQEAVKYAAAQSEVPSRRPAAVVPRLAMACLCFAVDSVTFVPCRCSDIRLQQLRADLWQAYEAAALSHVMLDRASRGGGGLFN